MPKQIAALLLAALLLASCGGSETPAGLADGETKTVTGVLTDIDSAAIDDINGFTLKDGDEQYTVLVDDEVEYGFALGHLQEHLQDALPVTVEMESRDGELYALSIADA